MAVSRPAIRENQCFQPLRVGRPNSCPRSPSRPIPPPTLPPAGQVADPADQSWRAESDAIALRPEGFFAIQPWRTWPNCSERRPQSVDSAGPGELGLLPWPRLESGHPVRALWPPWPKPERFLILAEQERETDGSTWERLSPGEHRKAARCHAGKIRWQRDKIRLMAARLILVSNDVLVLRISRRSIL